MTRRSPSVTGPERVDLQEAARRLNVHYMTAYRYVRTGRLPAVQQDGRWWVATADLKHARPGRQRTGRSGARAAQSVSRLRDRLVAGDEPGSWRILESALVAGGGPRAAVLQLLAPAMREVGDHWATGQLSVGDEHRATAVATRLVGRLSPAFARPGRSRGSVLLACVPGETHALPVAMLSLVLRGEGYQVIDLGGDTPADSIAAAVPAAGRRLRAVGLSVSTSRRSAEIGDAVEAVRSTPWGGPLLIGGPAVGSRAEAAALGADDWAADAAGVVTILEGLAGQRR